MQHELVGTTPPAAERAKPAASDLERARQWLIAHRDDNPTHEHVIRELAQEFAAVRREAATDMQQRTMRVVEYYAANPPSSAHNNTAEAFAMGMNHEAGCIDACAAIADAIAALAPTPEEEAP